MDLEQAGLDQSQFAFNFGVNKSTISRNLSRNKGQRGRRPKQAQSFREERKRGCLSGLKENRPGNGLLRQYFSKSMDVSNRSEEQV